MENDGLLKRLTDYLTSVKLNAILPPKLMKLEPRNGQIKDQDIEVKVFDPKLDGTTNRKFELQIILRGHASSGLSTLEGRRIKLTPSGSGSSYEARITRMGFAQFNGIPSAYYSLELKY